jgi:membrane protein implicated in regulation of membrane protease activity
VLAMSVSPDTSLIVVVDQSQRIIASSRSNLIDRPANAQPHLHSAADIARVITTHERFLEHVNGNDFDFVAPIAINGVLVAAEREQRGAVLVRMDVRAIRQDLIHDAMQVAAGLFAVVVLLSLAAWRQLQHHVLRPVDRIGAAVEKRRSGDTGALQRVAPADELGELAHTLDEAFVRIDAHGQQMTEARDERIPGRDEPRDPHADERRDRLQQPAAGYEARRRTDGFRPHDPRLGREPAGHHQ